jgi:hypothetical protein
MPTYLNTDRIPEYGNDANEDIHLRDDEWYDLNLLSIVYSIPNVKPLNKHNYAMLSEPVLALFQDNRNQYLPENQYLEIVKETIRHIVEGKQPQEIQDLPFHSVFSEDIRMPEFIIDLYGTHVFDLHLRLDCHDTSEVFFELLTTFLKQTSFHVYILVKITQTKEASPSILMQHMAKDKVAPRICHPMQMADTFSKGTNP